MSEKQEVIPDQESEPKVDLQGNHWELPTDLRILNQVRDEIERRLTELNWNSTDIYWAVLAFDELIINGIAHGNQDLQSYKGDATQMYLDSQELTRNNPTDKKVFVTFTMDERRVDGEVRDQGQGFEPTDQEEKAVNGGLLDASGRGYLALKRKLDTISYHKEEGVGTTVTFSYTRKQP